MTITLPKHIQRSADKLNILEQMYAVLNSIIQDHMNNTMMQDAKALQGLDIKKLRGAEQDYAARITSKYRLIYRIQIVKNKQDVPSNACKVIQHGACWKIVQLVDIRASDKQNKKK